MSATTPAATQQRRPTTRTKRSWTKVQVKLGADTLTFWPTPEGLHRRKKGSPKVQVRTWGEIHSAMNGDRYEFELDGRHYEVWRADDGMHVRRSGHEDHVVKWAQFIEFIDGQKLLPLV